MADATSPNDPVFFLHHTFLDKLWEDWKPQHRTVPPYSPTQGAPGYDLNSTLVFNASGQPSPWSASWTVQQALTPAQLGYSYA